MWHPRDMKINSWFVARIVSHVARAQQRGCQAVGGFSIEIPKSDGGATRALPVVSW